jgi:hypothetical protein
MPPPKRRRAHVLSAVVSAALAGAALGAAAPAASAEPAAAVSPRAVAPGDTITITVSCDPTGGPAPGTIQAGSQAFEQGTVELVRVQGQDDPRPRDPRDGGPGRDVPRKDAPHDGDGDARNQDPGAGGRPPGAGPGSASTPGSDSVTGSDAATGPDSATGSGPDDGSGSATGTDPGSGTGSVTGPGPDYGSGSATGPDSMTAPDQAAGGTSAEGNTPPSVVDTPAAVPDPAAGQGSLPGPTYRGTARIAAAQHFEGGAHTGGTSSEWTVDGTCPAAPGGQGRPWSAAFTVSHGGDHHGDHRGTGSPGPRHGVHAGEGGAFTDSVPAMAAGGLLIVGALGAAVQRLLRRGASRHR